MTIVLRFIFHGALHSALLILKAHIRQRGANLSIAFWFWFDVSFRALQSILGPIRHATLFLGKLSGQFTSTQYMFTST